MSEISFLFIISYHCSCQFLKQFCYHFPSQNQSLANVKRAGYVLCRMQLHSASSSTNVNIKDPSVTLMLLLIHMKKTIST